MKVKPLGNRILVRREEAEEKYGDHIILPENTRERPNEGTVVSVGRGNTLDDGTVQPLEVKVGTRVMFGQYSGTEIKVADGSLLMMKESDLLGYYEEE